MKDCLVETMDETHNDDDYKEKGRMGVITRGVYNLIKLWVILMLLQALFSAFSGLGKYEGQTAEEWFNDYDAQVAYSDVLVEALFQANSNIEYCNNSIEEAKSSISSWPFDEPTVYEYEKMKKALEAIEECETVDEP